LPSKCRLSTFWSQWLHLLSHSIVVPSFFHQNVDGRTFEVSDTTSLDWKYLENFELPGDCNFYIPNIRYFGNFSQQKLMMIPTYNLNKYNWTIIQHDVMTLFQGSKIQHMQLKKWLKPIMDDYCSNWIIEFDQTSFKINPPLARRLFSVHVRQQLFTLQP